MNYKSFFYNLSFVIVLITFVNFLNGCTSSEVVDVNEERIKDSINVYTHLDRAFDLYQKALNYNNKFQDADAKNAFEKSLKTLSEINSKVLNEPGNSAWKEDYNELAKSITQDFLITQQNIPDNNIVFKFAEKLGIEFERLNEYTQSEQSGYEPLPDGKDLPLIKNSVVEEYIDFFSKTDRGKSFIDKTMYRSGKFFPLMRKILRHYGAPEELIYLSIQESGLNPTIVSRAGAVGLWQFMPATGYAYGLYQDEWRDDRRDFEKATDAGARHLIDLFKTYDDWYLAFAAYNAGPGRVNSAIRKSGSKDFWVLRNYLPGETKNYVPSILALSFIFRNPEMYGFTDLELAKPISFDRANIKSSITFQQIADLSGSDLETIRELNPELTNDVTPNYNNVYQIRIPHGTFKTFSENYKNASFEKNGLSSPEFAGSEQFDFGQVAATKFKVRGYMPNDIRKIGMITDNNVKYTVKDNDKLSVIAIDNGVRATDVRLWNNLTYGRLLLKGMMLNIYLSENEKNIKEYNLDGSLENKETKDVTENSNSGNTNTTENNSNNETSSDEGTSFFDKITKGKNSKTTETQTKKTETTEKKNTKKETTTKQINKENKKETKKETKKENVSDDSGNDNTVKTVSTNTETKKKETVKKPAGKEQVYTVQEGDILSTIASSYSVKISEIQEWNGLESDVIYIGQKLKIYSDKKTESGSTKNSKTKEEKAPKTYTVKEGDNLQKIADKFNLKVSQLKLWNDIEDGDHIIIGQVLKLTEPEKKTNKKQTTKEKVRKKKGKN